MGRRDWLSVELTAQVRKQYPDWTPQAVGHVFGYLCQEGLLERAPGKSYRVGPQGLVHLPPEEPSVDVAEPHAPSLPLPAPIPEVASAPSESTLSSNELASLLLRLDEVETLEVQAKADAAKIADLTAKVQTLTAKLANFDTAVEQAVQAKLATMLRAKLK